MTRSLKLCPVGRTSARLPYGRGKRDWAAPVTCAVVLRGGGAGGGPAYGRAGALRFGLRVFSKIRGPVRSWGQPMAALAAETMIVEASTAVIAPAVSSNVSSRIEDSPNPPDSHERREHEADNKSKPDRTQPGRER